MNLINTTMNAQEKRTYYDKRIYTCSFCGKQAQGKPYSYLKNPSPHLDPSVALRPVGWDWNIVPVKFTDSWSCGCHKFTKPWEIR